MLRISSPWLSIPLEDYESHMQLPDVGQLPVLDALLGEALGELRPESVALIGCGPGTGLAHVDPDVTRRVVAIDVNATYLAAARARYAHRIPGFETIVHDVSVPLEKCERVAYAHAALLFEYVDAPRAMATIARLLASHGVLDVVLQLPSKLSAPVTATPYSSLQSLAPVMRLVSPGELRFAAREAGLRQTGEERTIPLPHGKSFLCLRFTRTNNTANE
jgi:SAM-dependent methyltransferase